MLLTLTSKIIKCMTKNWQEEFDRLEMNDRSSKGCSVCLAEMIGGKNMNILYEFITNLRKHDEEELIEEFNYKVCQYLADLNH